ncbi:MAG: Nucleotidyl transferase AbiEii toxin, Type system [Chitinophagaceae bacterium]|nr:Nucleotidyl transferase AbiEii toxin, Type system [Chitinophagaceae bacterium]
MIIPDKDPQSLYIKYRSLYDPHPWLAVEVKLEFGVRSFT